MKQITGNKLLVKALKEEGVEYLFGYPGACTIDISDELYKQDEIKIVLPRHEQALVHEADAYARTTGKVGVCLVTSGPGATNLVTGLATANYDSVPLVCFTGQVPRHLIGNDAFQEVDIVGITRSITKYGVTVRNREDLQRLTQIHYLGSLPKTRAKKRSAAFLDARYAICARLEKELKKKNMHTLLVTSAVAGEGKTTVACNLALGLEKKGYSVLLLDADLRKPAVCRTIQLDSGTEGAYEVLTGQRTAEEVKIRCRDTQLYVIAGTKSLSSTQQILGTGKIAEIIKQLEKEADLVIVDTPPAGILSDAAMLASCVDGGVFVVRQDFADVRILTEGIRELSEAGMEFAGCILNQTEHK